MMVNVHQGEEMTVNVHQGEGKTVRMGEDSRGVRFLGLGRMQG